MKIRRAQEDDLGDLLDLLNQAAEWLLSRGIEQWFTPFPTEYVLPALKRGETFLARCGGELAGTITLMHSYSYWPGSPPDALYIRRVAISRRFTGLGRMLMAWSEQQAIDEGKAYLRLDCYSGNQALRKYYEGLGFEHHSDIEVTAPRGTYDCSLYEKRVAQTR